MPTRRIERRLPPCHAPVELLLQIEGYLKQKSADMAAAAKVEYSESFVVTVQDSWGTTEYYSVEDIEPPLAEDVTRVRLTQTAYDGGVEYFSASVTFASSPPRATCQMRLTGETAETDVNGMMEDIFHRVRQQRVRGFVKRFDAPWLIVLLLAGVVVGLGSVPLFLYELYTWGVSLAAAGCLLLLYTFCSWRLSYCVFKTKRNDDKLDWNKWIWRSVFTSVVLAIIVRVALKVGFNI